MLRRWSFLMLAFCLWLPHAMPAATTFSVATFNLENYLDAPAGTRPLKSTGAKAAVCQSILAMRPDVLTLQEMGSTNALLELRDSLRVSGLDFPYWEHVIGFDTNIHVAILSRFPITARRPHTNESYLLHESRLHVSRGFAEVDIQVTTNYSFTLIGAHLKSKRPIYIADEAEMRAAEAQVLRECIDVRLKADPNANLVVLGDLNDLMNSRPVRTVIGRGRNALVDTHPAEREPGVPPGGSPAAREVTWTYHYALEDSFARIDYILLSHGMAREWRPQYCYVLKFQDWGLASDHRPVLATFEAEDK